MGIEEYLAEELAEGQRVSESSAFTLDPAQVRSRVATFCQEHRLYPLLRLLQGIIRVSEGELFLRYEKDSLVASFAWNDAPAAATFQSFILDGVSEGFDKVAHTASQHFFFGLSAALGVPHYRVSWTTPQGGFEVKNGKFQLVDRRTDQFCHVAFAVDAGWWDRLTTGKRQQADTEAELRSRLCYAPIPVHIEGERLLPRLPDPPDRPWALQLTQGSNLAWRFLAATSGGRFQPPEIPFDRYRASTHGKGKAWHLVRPDAKASLPLNLQIYDLPSPPSPTGAALPGRSLFETGSSPLSSPLSQTAFFLTLDVGRQDWLFPVRDGLLGTPMPINIAKGGIVVVSADDELRYDLSGLQVVRDKHLDAKLVDWRAQVKSVNNQFRLSLANITIRAETLPSQYYQALGYLTGGPVLGMLGGTLGPAFNRMFGSKPVTAEEKEQP